MRKMDHANLLVKNLLCVLLLSVIYSNANAQNFNWAKSFGNSSLESGYAITTDAAGNVYTTGDFNGITDFDPGPGVFNLDPGIATNIFVSKLDSAGNFIWAIQMGGMSSNEGRGITLDANGNLYITGDFSDTADFDPGPGIFNLYATDYRDVFIAKLDTAGNFIWAKDISGIAYGVFANSIAVDGNGNVYTTGNFRDTVDFDPGPGVYSLYTPNFDIFISKLDSSGNFVYAKNMGATTYNYGYGIAIDAWNNVYATGSFRLTVDFDPGPDSSYLTSNGYDDVYVLKLDPTGNFIWAKNMGGIGNDISRAMALDAAGNIYFTGTFESTADFDPGTAIFNLQQSGVSGGDLFVAKLDSAGNLVWAKAMGGTGLGYGAGIALDAAGNVYTTGYFEGVTAFDPTGGFNLTSTWFTGGDVYVSILSNAGNFIWAGKMGSNSYEYGRAIAVDAAGNIYTTGGFTGVADFDPGTAVYNLNSNGNLDIFVCKLGGVSTAITDKDLVNNFKIYPNPITDHLVIQLQKDFANVSINLKNVMGQNVLTEYYALTNKIDLQLQALKAELYFVEIIAGDNIPVVVKLIKQ